jgi:hypothetical protein
VAANFILPALTAALGFAFSAILATRFARRRQPHYGAWSLGLLFYATAAASEAIGAAATWSPDVYKLWYITGAIGVAAYLGAGSVYLHKDKAFAALTVVCLLIGCIPALATRHATLGTVGLGAAILATVVLTTRPARFADAIFAALVLTSVAASVQIMNATVDTQLLPKTAEEVVSGQAFDAEIRALTPGFNIAGAAILVLGAALSALRYWRTRAQPERVVSNGLIAVGAFVPSIASGLTRFGITSVFFVGELIGMACIIAGFVLSTSRPTPGPSSPGARRG